MKNGMSAKELLPLVGIAFSAFVFNTSEFMPIALLVDIAADFQVSESQAGILITAYAWAVCILSLPLMVFASRFGFRNLLLGLVALFGTCQVLSALAPGIGRSWPLESEWLAPMRYFGPSRLLRRCVWFASSIGPWRFPSLSRGLRSR